MLFSAKTKGFFVELSDYGCLFARTSALGGPLIVEEIEECPVNDAAAFEQALKKLQPKKTPSGYERVPKTGPGGVLVFGLV